MGGRTFSFPISAVETICALRARNTPWTKIAYQFGCGAQTLKKFAAANGLYKAAPICRFTPEEDATIRADWFARIDMSVTAQKLNRSVEVIRQRIHHHHKDLRGRSGAVQRFLNRYGLELLSLAATPEEAMKVFYRKQLEARASAKERANKAKEAHYATQIRLMLEQINAGQPRNYAIFETRATGVSLQRIGDCFGVTRERIRQICEKVAVEVALGKSISEPKEDLPSAVLSRLN